MLLTAPTSNKPSHIPGPDSTKDSSRYKDIPCKDKGFVTDLSFLEIENRELKMKIRRLEKELADKVMYTLPRLRG